MRFTQSKAKGPSLKTRRVVFMMNPSKKIIPPPPGVAPILLAEVAGANLNNTDIIPLGKL